MGLEELRAQLEDKKVEIREFIKKKEADKAEKEVEEKKRVRKVN